MSLHKTVSRKSKERHKYSSVIQGKNYAFRVILYKVFLQFPRIPKSSLMQEWQAETQPVIELIINNKPLQMNAFQETNEASPMIINFEYGLASVDTRYVIECSSKRLRNCEMMSLRISTSVAGGENQIKASGSVDVLSTVKRWLEEEENIIVDSNHDDDNIRIPPWKDNTELILDLLEDNSDLLEPNIVAKALIRIDLLNSTKLENETQPKPVIERDSNLEKLLGGNFGEEVGKHFFDTYIDIPRPEPALIDTVLPTLMKLLKDIPNGNPDTYDLLAELYCTHSANPIKEALLCYGDVINKLENMMASEVQQKVKWEEIKEKSEQRVVHYLDQVDKIPKGPKYKLQTEKLLEDIPRLGLRLSSEGTAAHPVIHTLLLSKWKETFPVSLLGKSLVSRNSILSLITTPKYRFGLQAIFFMVFLFFITFPNFGIYNDYTIYFHERLVYRFSEGRGGATGDGNDFKEIDNEPAFWDWAINILPPSFNNDPGFDTYLQLVGTPHIRQFRVEPKDCEYPPPNNTRTPCMGALRRGGGNWQSPPDYVSYKNSLWMDDVGQFIPWAQITPLTPGGFVTYLSRNPAEMASEIKELMDTDWIDPFTRAVLIEFTVFVPNADTFGMCAYLVEFASNGNIKPTPFYTFLKQTDLELADNFWVTIVILIFLFGYIAQEIQEMILEQIDYFKDPWNYIDIVLYTGLLIELIMRFTLPGRVNPYTIDDEELFRLWYFSYGLDIVHSFLTFLGYIRLLYFLRVSQDAGPLIVAVIRMVWDVFSFLVLVIILLFAFAQFFVVLFRNELEDYQSFTNSMFTLVQAAYGNFEFFNVNGGFSFTVALGNVAMGLYCLLVIILLVNLLIAMMGNTYDDVRAKAQGAWGFQFASLVLRFSSSYYPPPINLFFLAYLLIKKCANRDFKIKTTHQQDFELGLIKTDFNIKPSTKQNKAAKYIIFYSRLARATEFDKSDPQPTLDMTLETSRGVKRDNEMDLLRLRAMSRTPPPLNLLPLSKAQIPPLLNSQRGQAPLLNSQRGQAPYVLQ